MSLRDAFKFHSAHGGGIVGETAIGAIRSARAELRAKFLKDAGLLRYQMQPEETDPEDCFSDQRDIDAIRSGRHIWVSIWLETRDAICAKECDPEYCRCRGWQSVASLGGIDALGYSDPYLRVVRAELAIEADLPEGDDPAMMPIGTFDAARAI